MTKPLANRPRLSAEHSITNSDERRDHMVDDSPHRQCATCIAITPRSNAGTLMESDCGACTRIAFLMSGLAMIKDTTLSDKQRAETRNRPTIQERDELFDKGYRFWDITDIRNKQYWCRHHTHSLTMAPEIMAHFGHTVEDFREWLPELLAKWFDDGCPVVDHTPVKLSNGMVPAPEESMPQIPDVYLEGYNPCSMCTHYRRGIDPVTDVGIPHKGMCTFGSKNKGALSLLANEERDTYSFLSCNKFHMDPKRVSERAERPSQLFGFAELNPMFEPIADKINYYAHLPRAFLPAPLSDEELEVLDNHDLVTGVQSRMDEVDHLAFTKDMAFMPVATHFAKRIKANSVTEAVHWSRYSHYNSLGLSIYEDNSEEQGSEQ